MKIRKRLAAHEYYEIVFESRHQGEDGYTAFFDWFEEAGGSRDELAVFPMNQTVRAAVYTRLRRRVTTLDKSFRKSRPRSWKMRIKVLQKGDWFDKWQSHYEMIPCGTRFVIIPPQHKPPRSGKRIPVLLDARGAFGTGTHPTTQLMVRFLEMTAGKYRTMLDLGTGTGILSILASHLGAEQLTALDLDPGSVKAARFNWRKNGIRGSLEQQDFLCEPLRGKYDLVAANVISKVLERGWKAMKARVRPGGYLAVSGIHLQNLKEMRAKLRSPEMRCLRILRLRGWAGILYCKQDKTRS